jgi:hypothetical protein
MLVFVENKVQEGQIPEIWETEEDEQKSFKDLRRFYISYVKSRFQGKMFRNKALNEAILVSRDGIDKLEGMLSFREQCLAVQLLDKFLIDSTVEDRQPDKKGRWNVDEFIYLSYQCRISGKSYKALTTVKKTVNNPLKFYGYILLDVKIEATHR